MNLQLSQSYSPATFFAASELKGVNVSHSYTPNKNSSIEIGLPWTFSVSKINPSARIWHRRSSQGESISASGSSADILKDQEIVTFFSWWTFLWSVARQSRPWPRQRDSIIATNDSRSKAASTDTSKDCNSGRRQHVVSSGKWVSRRRSRSSTATALHDRRRRVCSDGHCCKQRTSSSPSATLSPVSDRQVSEGPDR